ncbi:MAG: hypothetical protein ACW97G_13160, partial [Candidatus Thorarchaeota archaeon]
MIWLIFVGLFVLVIGIYWMSSSSRRRGYRNPKSRDTYLSLAEHQREEDEIRFREMEERRQP